MTSANRQVSPAAILRAARAAGVQVELSPDGSSLRIQCAPDRAAGLERIRPTLAKHKASILEHLKSESESRAPPGSRAPSALVGDRGGGAEGESVAESGPEAAGGSDQPAPEPDSSLYAWISAVSAAAPVAEFGPAIVVLHRPGRKGLPGKPYKAVTLADYVAACEHAAKVAAEPMETGDEKAKGRPRR